MPSARYTFMRSCEQTAQGEEYELQECRRSSVHVRDVAAYVNYILFRPGLLSARLGHILVAGSKPIGSDPRM
jgi:hypothetical protein